MAVVVALSFGRDAHTAGRGRAGRYSSLMPGAGRDYGCAVCGNHAGDGRLYYSAADRKPDGKPGSED